MISLCVRGSIQNFRLISFSIDEGDTGAVMFEMVTQILQGLFGPFCCKKIE